MKHLYRVTIRGGDIFPGFYESMFFNSDSLYYAGQNDKVPDGYSYEVDFNKFTSEVTERWCDVVFDSIPHDIIKEFKYAGLYSPREYNFTTDAPEVSVKFNKTKLNTFCYKTLKAEFDGYLHEYWSDRDGFWSFVPNNIEGFRRNEDIDVMIEFYLRTVMDDWNGFNCGMAEYANEAMYNNMYLENEDYKAVDYAFINDEVVPLDTEERVARYERYCQKNNPAQLVFGF